MFYVNHLRCEYKTNPIGIDVLEPRISWCLESDERAVLQGSYRIQVATDLNFNEVVWDSGIVLSEQSLHVELMGLSMQPRMRYYYRIQAGNQRGELSVWSYPAYWEMGLLSSKDWTASWISAPNSLREEDSQRCPIFRKSFEIPSDIQKARIYVTALGLYELALNGQRVGDSYFTPGWTSYNKRLQYQTYDVTDLLQVGENTIGGMLGNGWYKGSLVSGDNIYGDRSSLLLQLEVTLKEGTEKFVVSDASWKACGGPVLMSEIYHGETYHAGLEQPNWDSIGFDDSSWVSVDLLTYTNETLIAQENEPVVHAESIVPVEFIRTPKGESVIDFGQNMVGWVRFTVRGEAGDEVILHHAEVLDQDGNFYTDNLRKAKQEIRYILKGDQSEVFEPHFTFQGFRYVRLTGFKEPVSLQDFTGIVLYSGMEQTGFFECSDPMINQLQHNIEWGLKGNFLDVPTDCPQRDERLGWTGDAQMFIRTAAYLRNVNPFFTKWMRDLKADQAPNGVVPVVIPDVLQLDDFCSSAWGDAAVIIPWTLYICYGDVRILEQQYESMKAWVEYIRCTGEDEFLWNTGKHYGDWLGLDAKPDSYVGATDKDFVSTAFYAYSVSLLQKTATILDHQADAEAYLKLYAHILNAFENEFITPAGRLSVPTQTAQVLGLMFDLLRGTAKKRAVDKLIELLEESKYHLTTGFVGTPYLNHVLSENGHGTAAYKLLLQKDYPSWLYPITKGATTIWEHWDSIREDGSFWSTEMNSFNHYAYGSIGDWLYRNVAGIDTDESVPGYKKLIIRPQLHVEELSWAEGRLNTMYGSVRSSWRKLEGGSVELQVSIPVNTTAEIRLPGATIEHVTESGNRLAEENGIHSYVSVGQDLHLSVGSGHYVFVW